jgi:sialic acid synthase SpsE
VSEAEALADQLDLSGIEIYAIGLGESVDRDFIRNIASSLDTTFFAPTGASLESDLANIYATITSSLCETGPTKIDVIAKTTANFTPLR